PDRRDRARQELMVARLGGRRPRDPLPCRSQAAVLRGRRGVSRGRDSQAVNAPSRFHGRLTLALLGESCGRPVWRVESSITYWSPVLYAGLEYGDLLTIPVGFETDLASVPRVPIAWLLAGGVANGPAVVHDYLYA